MYPVTVRNIALISPMRQRFNALSGASSFAEKIIEKYSKTEPFPFSGEALVFLKALGDKLRDEQSIRDDVTYTLRLLIVHRLLVDGKLTDPTVGKNYLNAVEDKIEQNISRLRITDNNAYIRMTDARSYIENSAELGDIILSENINNEDRNFVYSFADTHILNDRFFGSGSNSYAYSGIYNYIPVHDLIYKKEKVGEEAVRIGDFLLPGVSNNVVNVQNAGETNYSYNNENLTYKTENDNEQDIQNFANETKSVTNVNESNTENINETAVSVSDTSITNETVVNAGDNNYSYNNEDLTYKTENNTTENSETVYEQSVNNFADKSESTSVVNDNESNTENKNETAVSASDTSIKNETVVNAGDNNYSYNNEDLTYKTENNSAENSETVSNQSINNFADKSESTSVTNVNESNTEKKNEKTVSVSDTSITNETVVNAGDNNYSYNNENLTYKTENNTTENSETVYEQSVNSFADKSESTSVVNVNESNTENKNETIVSASDSSLINQNETVVNAGETNYSYNNEDLTYKTENNSAENSETVYEQSVNNFADKSESTSVTNVNEFNTESKNETAVSVSDTNITNETVVNAGETNYSYNNENLTYKAENNTTENSETISEQSINNFADNSESTSVVNVNESNTENKNETVVSASDSSLINQNETVVNAGETNYSYNNEDLTYKTENSVSEQSGSSLAGASASETAHIPETAQPQKVSDLAEIGLLVMNSFLSGGSQYLSSVKEKYIHKLRLLSREVTAKAVHDKAAANAGRDSSVSSVSVLNRLLSEKKELTDEERRIYDTAVRNVYLESHESKNDITTEKMLEKLSVTERTKALSQMIGRLMNDSRSGIITAPSANRAAISAENNNNDPETGRNENGSAAERVRSAIVNVLSYINNDKNDISDSETSGAYPSSAEMQLLSFITGKSGSEARKIINDPKTRNALSLQLGQLYFRIADVSVQQKVLLERVKQAAEMPYRAILVPTHERKAKKQSYRDNAAYNVSKNNSYDNDYTTINNISVLDNGLPNSEKGSAKSSVKESASAGKGEPAEYVQGTEFVPTLHRLTERSGDEYTTINNISVLDKGLPNSENGGAKDSVSGGKGEPAEYVQGTEFVPTLHRLTERSGDEYTTVNNISVLEKGLPNSENGGAKDSASGGKGEPAEYVQGTEFVPTLHRFTDRLNTVNNLLERIAARKGAFETITGVNAKSRENTGYNNDTRRYGPASEGSSGDVYEGAQYSLAFTNEINAYLPAGIAPDHSAIADSITLLPIFGYEKLILPKKKVGVSVSENKASDRMHAVPTQKHITKNRSINIINKNIMSGISASQDDNAAQENALSSRDMQMIRPEHETVALRYREPAAAAQTADRNMQAMQQPSHADLVKQFGNLIEGADAGLVPSFDVGTHGISEAMSAIEQTAEKVQLNSKLIEEIREKQREIEEVTLKSTDMDAISDEMIRKLRSHLRLDKSRFAQ